MAGIVMQTDAYRIGTVRNVRFGTAKGDSLSVPHQQIRLISSSEIRRSHLDPVVPAFDQGLAHSCAPVGQPWRVF